MKADRKTWIKIGEGQQREQLQEAAQDIEVKWPNRFDFRITPDSPTAKLPAAPYRLFLKHR